MASVEAFDFEDVPSIINDASGVVPREAVLTISTRSPIVDVGGARIKTFSSSSSISSLITPPPSSSSSSSSFSSSASLTTSSAGDDADKMVSGPLMYHPSVPKMAARFAVADSVSAASISAHPAPEISLAALERGSEDEGSGQPKRESPRGTVVLADDAAADADDPVTDGEDEVQMKEGA